MLDTMGIKDKTVPVRVNSKTAQTKQFSKIEYMMESDKHHVRGARKNPLKFSFSLKSYLSSSSKLDCLINFWDLSSCVIGNH